MLFFKDLSPTQAETVVLAAAQAVEWCMAASTMAKLLVKS